MKKLLFALSAIALLAGCNDRNDSTLPTPSGNQNPDIPQVIHAGFADEDASDDTRTYVVDDTDILWQNGDEISYFGDLYHNLKYQYNGKDGVTHANFTLVPDKENKDIQIYRSKAIYPYNSENEYDQINDDPENEMITIIYPAEQTYAEKSFGRGANVMVASGKSNNDTEFYFRNACGFLIIQLYATGTTTKVKSIELTAIGGERLSGYAGVRFDNEGVPSIQKSPNGEPTVTLNCGDGVAISTDAEEPTEFWFALPPVTFSDGFKIVATTVESGAFSKQTSQKVVVERNSIQPMKALALEVNTSSDNQLWYTTKSGNKLTSWGKGYNEAIISDDDAFDANIISHEWDAALSQFVISFDKPLTTIKQYAFRFTDLQTITLPETMTTIDDYAFWGTPLIKITIPGNVTYVGYDAFQSCEKLTSVTFEPNANKIPLKIRRQYNNDYSYNAFADSPLTTINLNRDIDDGSATLQAADTYYNGLFYYKGYKTRNATATAKVTIGNQVTTINNYMFCCLPIEEITIPGTVNTIGNSAFNTCEKLTSVTFEPSASGTPLVMGYDDYLDDEGPFRENCPLATLNLNREITYTFGGSDIDNTNEGLFGGIATLTSVTLGEQVKTIGEFMFAGTGLTELTIPGNVTEIQNNAFTGTKLQTLTIESGNTALKMGYDTNGEVENLFVDNETLTTLNLDRNIDYYHIFQEGAESVDTPSEGAFGGIECLTNINLGEHVTNLEPYMFAGTGIATIKLPSSLTTIEEFVFYDCDQLTELTIPGTVTEIKNNVFRSCDNFAKITFEPSKTDTPLVIGYDTAGEDENLFVGNTKLTTLNLNRELDYNTGFGENNIDTNSEGMFGGIETLTDVTIGEQVKTIEKFMFAGTGITTLKFDEPSVATIKKFAFNECESLESLTIPGCVTTIENDVFDGCSGLTALNFLPSATDTPLVIGYDEDDGEDENLFEDDCTKLATLDLNRELDYNTGFGEENINSNSEGMFGGIESLTTVRLGEQVKTIEKYMFAGTNIVQLTIPESVTTIKEHAFSDCAELIKCHNLGNPTTIEQYTFNNCEKLDAIIFPGSVTTIKEFAFNGCKAITNLTIPGTVTEIKNNVFRGCSGLTTLTFDSSLTNTPLTIGYDTDGEAENLFEDYCTNLTTLNLNRKLNYTFGDSYITSNTEGLFGGIESLKNVYLGEQATTIEKYMFAGTGITSITIPATVNTIMDNAFNDCTQLQSITFDLCEKSLTIKPQSGAGPFYDSPLVTINLYRELFYESTYSSWYYGLFASSHWDNGVKKTVNLSKGDETYVKTIHPWMFTGVNVANIWIPNTIERIGTHAFDDCKSLETVTMGHDSDKIPNIGEDVFYDCDTFEELGKIKIRKRAEQYFRDAADWNAYEDKFFTSEDFQ